MQGVSRLTEEDQNQALVTGGEGHTRSVAGNWGGVGGDSPSNKLYSYAGPQRIWFLSRFRLKNGYRNHFGLTYLKLQKCGFCSLLAEASFPLYSLN